MSLKLLIHFPYAQLPQSSLPHRRAHRQKGAVRGARRRSGAKLDRPAALTMATAAPASPNGGPPPGLAAPPSSSSTGWGWRRPRRRSPSGSKAERGELPAQPTPSLADLPNDRRVGTPPASPRRQGRRAAPPHFSPGSSPTSSRFSSRASSPASTPGGSPLKRRVAGRRRLAAARPGFRRSSRGGSSADGRRRAVADLWRRRCAAPWRRRTRVRGGCATPSTSARSSRPPRAARRRRRRRRLGDSSAQARRARPRGRRPAAPLRRVEWRARRYHAQTGRVLPAAGRAPRAPPGPRVSGRPRGVPGQVRRDGRRADLLPVG